MSKIVQTPKRERDALKKEIEARNVMTRRVGGLFKNAIMGIVIFGILAFWGLSGYDDPILSLSKSTQHVWGIVFLVIAIIAAILAIMSFISYNNSKKYVLHLIDLLDKK